MLRLPDPRTRALRRQPAAQPLFIPDQNKSCAGLVFYVFGEITGFGAFIVYAIVTYWFIIAAAFVVDVFKSAFPGYGVPYSRGWFDLSVISADKT